jgi:hypothetical protein
MRRGSILGSAPLLTGAAVAQALPGMENVGPCMPHQVMAIKHPSLYAAMSHHAEGLD